LRGHAAQHLDHAAIQNVVAKIIAARADNRLASSIEPENSDDAQGSSIPSHWACDNPNVGSHASMERNHDPPAFSRAFAASNPVKNAFNPSAFHDARIGQSLPGMTGETNRGVASEASSTVIEAGNECDSPQNGLSADPAIRAAA
jgi:hypothetical protein